MGRSWIRLLAAGLAVLAVLVALSQLAIPEIVEGRAEDRLTAEGGTAKVEVSAFPAVALLLGSGGRIEVRGSDIPLNLITRQRDGLDRLDDYEEVDVRLSRLRAGPVDTAAFTLRRSGRDSAYRMRADARITPDALARFAGEQLGGSLGGILGDLAGGLLPFGDTPLPVEIDAALVRADDGGVRVTDGGGSVAGIPLGPLAELLVEAVAARL